ncbi:MAG: hypothetical protein HY677_07315 [Chloroflexi bacterium]|nr:hypothetical protein [Chloroflexota bacterium]
MAYYVVESKHDDKECLKALDEFAEKGRELLKQCYFGCMMGDHRSWAVLDKGSEEEVRRLIPETLRNDTKVISVGKFTEEQIRGFHKAA